MNFTDTIKALAGKRYRVERGEDGFYQVPLRDTCGKSGHIYQHGPDTLAAHITGTTRPTQTFKAIRAKCPATTLHVVGEDELIVLHPMEGWKRFFSVCGARTRRALSEEERERLAQAGRQFLFSPGVQGGRGAVESPNAA